MKFEKNISCERCENKCDIYLAFNTIKPLYNRLKPVHIFYSKNEYVCKQGNPVSGSIYLISGSAKLYIEGINNKNIILYITTPGNYIGLLSFFESNNYSYSVKTLEDSHICMIDLEIIKKLYVDNHEFLLKLNKAFGKSVKSILEKIITLNQKNIRGRIADSLLYLSKHYKSDSFNMLLSRKELGELSAISEENAVRLLTEFKKEGIINVDGKNITIVDKKLLTKISEVG